MSGDDPRNEQRPQDDATPEDLSIDGLGCGDDPCPPPIDFVTFVTSLSAAALYHLGVMPDPDTNQKILNVPMARQTIDLIQMLREKTMGNLTASEQALVDGVLYDLKTRFIRVVG
jgi:hypothetical protein